jgi:hypothetical protein
MSSAMPAPSIRSTQAVHDLPLHDLSSRSSLQSIRPDRNPPHLEDSNNNYPPKWVFIVAEMLLSISFGIATACGAGLIGTKFFGPLANNSYMKFGESGRGLLAVSLAFSVACGVFSGFIICLVQIKLLRPRAQLRYPVVNLPMIILA